MFPKLKVEDGLGTDFKPSTSTTSMRTARRLSKTSTKTRRRRRASCYFGVALAKRALSSPNRISLSYDTEPPTFDLDLGTEYFLRIPADGATVELALQS
jgi:hypothetical protein